METGKETIENTLKQLKNFQIDLNLDKVKAQLESINFKVTETNLKKFVDSFSKSMEVVAGKTKSLIEEQGEAIRNELIETDKGIKKVIATGLVGATALLGTLFEGRTLFQYFSEKAGLLMENLTDFFNISKVGLENIKDGVKTFYNIFSNVTSAGSAFLASLKGMGAGFAVLLTQVSQVYVLKSAIKEIKDYLFLSKDNIEKSVSPVDRIGRILASIDVAMHQMVIVRGKLLKSMLLGVTSATSTILTFFTTSSSLIASISSPIFAIITGLGSVAGLLNVFTRWTFVTRSTVKAWFGDGKSQITLVLYQLKNALYTIVKPIGTGFWGKAKAFLGFGESYLKRGMSWLTSGSLLKFFEDILKAVREITAQLQAMSKVNLSQNLGVAQKQLQSITSQIVTFKQKASSVATSIPQTAVRIPAIPQAQKTSTAVAPTPTTTQQASNAVSLYTTQIKALTQAQQQNTTATQQSTVAQAQQAQQAQASIPALKAVQKTLWGDEPVQKASRKDIREKQEDLFKKVLSTKTKGELGDVMLPQKIAPDKLRDASTIISQMLKTARETASKYFKSIGESGKRAGDFIMNIWTKVRAEINKPLKASEKDPLSETQINQAKRKQELLATYKELTAHIQRLKNFLSLPMDLYPKKISKEQLQNLEKQGEALKYLANLEKVLTDASVEAERVKTDASKRDLITLEKKKATLLDYLKATVLSGQKITELLSKEVELEKKIEEEDKTRKQGYAERMKELARKRDDLRKDIERITKEESEKVLLYSGIPIKALLDNIKLWGEKIKASGLLNSGAKIVTQLMDGVRSKYGLLRETFTKLTDYIMKFFPRSPALLGALRLLVSSGAKIPVQLAEGVKKGGSSLIDAVDSLASRVMEAFKPMLDLQFEASKLKMDTNELRKWEYALAEFGIKAGDMMFVFENMRKMTSSPDADQASLMKRLGINLEDLSKTPDTLQNLYIEVLKKVQNLRELVEEGKTTKGEYQNEIQKLFEALGVSQMSNFARALQSGDIEGAKARFAEFSKLQMNMSDHYLEMIVKLNRYWEQIKQVTVVLVNAMYEQVLPAILAVSKQINEFIKANSGRLKASFIAVGQVFKTLFYMFGEVLKSLFSDFSGTMESIVSYLFVFIPYLGRIAVSLLRPIYTDILQTLWLFLKALFNTAYSYIVEIPNRIGVGLKKTVAVMMNDVNMAVLKSVEKLAKGVAYVMRRIPGLAETANSIEKAFEQATRQVAYIQTASVATALDKLDAEIEKRQKQAIQRTTREFEKGMNELNNAVRKNAGARNWIGAWEDIKKETEAVFKDFKEVSKSTPLGNKLTAYMEELSRHLSNLGKQISGMGDPIKDATDKIEKSSDKQSGSLDKLRLKLDETKVYLSSIKEKIGNSPKTALEQVTGRSPIKLATDIGEKERQKKLQQYDAGGLEGVPFSNSSQAKIEQGKTIAVTEETARKFVSIREKQVQQELEELKLKHEKELLEMSKQNYSKLELEKVYLGMKAIEEKKANELSVKLEKEKQLELARIKAGVFPDKQNPFDFEGIGARTDFETIQMEQKRDEDLQKMRDYGASQLEIEKVKGQYATMISEQSSKYTQTIITGLLQFAETSFATLATTMDKLYILAGKRFKGLWYAGKAFAIAQAVVNTALGVTQAIAQGGIFGIITGAIVAAAGAVQIATIAAETYAGPAELAKGGIIKSGTTPTADDVPALLSRGEAVLPAKAVQYYGEDNIAKMISGKLGKERIVSPEIPEGFFISPITKKFSEGGIINPMENLNISSSHKNSSMSSSSQGKTESGGSQNNVKGGTNIVNIVDPSLLQQYLNTSQGRNAIFNIISNNSARFRTALST